MRNHNREFQDSSDRKYAYDFDGIIRRYLLKSLQPFFNREGRALELGSYKGDMTEQILALGGALISEFPMNTLAAPQNFPIRNRIIRVFRLACW